MERVPADKRAGQRLGLEHREADHARVAVDDQWVLLVVHTLTGYAGETDSLNPRPEHTHACAPVDLRACV